MSARCYRYEWDVRLRHLDWLRERVPACAQSEEERVAVKTDAVCVRATKTEVRATESETDDDETVIDHSSLSAAVQNADRIRIH